MIPKVTKLHDIPPAMEALEKFLMQEIKDEMGLSNLNAHAIKMSARAVVELYKTKQPKTKDDFIRFIKDLPHRFSRVGFTGEPYSEVNALLAQIACACEPGSQERFWKILYPEITGLIDGGSNTQWPEYGEAILSEKLSQKSPGPILNYRQIWKTAETAPLKLIEETHVSSFCPAHRDYWLEVVTRRKRGSANHLGGKLVFRTEFDNYYEFFESMCAFMWKYNSNNNSNWSYDFATTSEGVQVLLDFRVYQEIVLNAPKILKEIFKSIEGLPEVLNKVAGEITEGKFSANPGYSCFVNNSQRLKCILERKEVQSILSEVKFAPKFIASSNKDLAPIKGHDSLLYLREHASQLGTLSEDSLIALIKQHEAYGLSLNVLVDLCRPILAASAHPTRKLFNLVYQIDDLTITSKIIELVLGEPLNFKKFIQGREMDDGIYGLKLLNYVDMTESEKSKSKEVLNQFLAKGLIELNQLLSQILEMKSISIPRMIDFLQKQSNQSNEINTLVMSHFYGLDDFQKDVSLLKSKLDIFCGRGNYDQFQENIAIAIIEALVISPIPKRANSKIIRQHRVLIETFLEKWIPQNIMSHSDYLGSSLLDLIQKYEKFPGIKSKIEGVLDSDFICRYLIAQYRDFWTLPLEILRRRNYVMTADQLYKILLKSFACNQLEDCATDSLIFDFFLKEVPQNIKFNDYIKIGSILNPKQRTLLKKKNPRLKRPLESETAHAFDEIISVIPLYNLLDFALDQEKSGEGLAEYCHYFKDELGRLLRCVEEDISSRFEPYSRKGYKPEHIFNLLFEKIVKRYGFEDTMKNFSPLFVSYLIENPSKMTSFMIHSKHGDEICDFLSGQDLRFSVLDPTFHERVCIIFKRYPKLRKRIIQESIASSDSIDIRTVKNFMPMLTHEEMKLFFVNIKILSFLEELIRDNSYISAGSPCLIRDPIDFIVGLFKTLPEKYLFERQIIWQYILRKLETLAKGHDDLAAIADKIHPKLYSMILTKTSRPLVFSQSLTGGQGQMDLHTAANSKKRSFPD
jgi:hypothetical protein